MRIKELTIQAFNEYAKNSPLKNYMQSEEYARLMGENKYNYDYIGLLDESNCIIGASLVLWRKIGLNMYYGYAPKGFLINYYDERIINMFVSALKVFYAKKNMVFIKINPEIVVATLDNDTKMFKENPNVRLKHDLERLGFVKLKDNMYFEAMNPRFNAYIDLKNTRLEKYSKVNRNKVRNAKRKGLYTELGTEADLEEFCKFATPKHSLAFYKTVFNLFKDKIDFIVIRVNYENFLTNSQLLYEEEQDRNNLYNEILHRSHKESDLHRKMASDSRLCSIKDEIITATEGLRSKDGHMVAAALVIKHDNRVHIVESSFDREYANLNANYFLYDAIIENYKLDYDYLDIGGVTGDFKESNPYRGLNRFKLGFSPVIYEYIGEFDLVFNRSLYDNLRSTGRLAQEFNKKS